LDGDYKPAIRLLEEINRKLPGLCRGDTDKLAWATLWMAITQALSYYNEALVIDLSDLFSLYELGKYHFISGDKPRARKYLNGSRNMIELGEYQAKEEKRTIQNQINFFWK